MSLAAESPSQSLSSNNSADEFAALLDAELELASAEASSHDDGNGAISRAEVEIEGEDEVYFGADVVDEEVEPQRRKRIKLVDVKENMEPLGKVEDDRNDQKKAGISGSAGANICPPHPGFFKGMCMRCGQLEGDASGVAFGYIHPDLKLDSSEIDRLRGMDLKKLLVDKKLVLILDLDHTLLNSTHLMDVNADEQYLLREVEASKGDPDKTLYKLDSMHMLTKLRPFIRTFLKEANKYFEMYIYTMAERTYALEIGKILDPSGVYFQSRIISQGDCTQRHLKGLDVVLGAENLVLILDDTEYVWQKHKENLILMERYHFFASSRRQFGKGMKSLSESMKDENESDGALATTLDVLRRAHAMFFNPDEKTDITARDVRQILKQIRQEILQGCKVVFSRIFPSKSNAEDQHIWKMADRLGATCCLDVDDSVTHVIAVDRGTEKARWAVQNSKFLVNPGWIEAANYLWRRHPEGDFPVARADRKPAKPTNVDQVAS